MFSQEGCQRDSRTWQTSGSIRWPCGRLSPHPQFVQVSPQEECQDNPRRRQWSDLVQSPSGLPPPPPLFAPKSSGEGLQAWSRQRPISGRGRLLSDKLPQLLRRTPASAREDGPGFSNSLNSRAQLRLLFEVLPPYPPPPTCHQHASHRPPGTQSSRERAATSLRYPRTSKSNRS